MSGWRLAKLPKATRPPSPRHSRTPIDVFAVEVECLPENWAWYGSGAGYEFQELCKSCPAFAVESCAVGLRNLRQHWGPIGRKEVELLQEADDMFLDVQDYVDEMEGPGVA